MSSYINCEICNQNIPIIPMMLGNVSHAVCNHCDQNFNYYAIGNVNYKTTIKFYHLNNEYIYDYIFERNTNHFHYLYYNGNSYVMNINSDTYLKLDYIKKYIDNLIFE